MKRKGIFLLLLFLLTVSCLAALPADLRYFIPQDAQIVLQVRDLTMFNDVMKALGYQELFVTHGGPALAKALKDPAFTLTAADVDDLAKSNIQAAVRFYDPATRAIAPRGVLVLHIGSPKLENAVQALLKPELEKATKLGPFSLIADKTPASETRPAENKYIAVGEGLLIFAYQYELPEMIAALRASAGCFEWPGPACKNVHVENQDVKIRLLVRGGQFGEWVGAVTDMILKNLDNKKEAPAPESDDAAARPEGGEEAAAQAAQAALKAMFPPEKIRQFIAGIGLDSIRDIQMVLCEKDGVCKSIVSLGLADGQGMINRYTRTLEGTTLKAADLFPADTSMGADMIVDIGGLYTMVKDEIVKSFGAGIATMIGIFESGLTAQTGLSLQGDIFATCGSELGFLQAGKDKLDIPMLQLLPFNTAFCVPKDPTAIDRIGAALTKQFGAQVLVDPVAEGKRYTFVFKGDKDVVVHGLLARDVFFVSPSADAIAVIRNGLISKKFLVENPEVKARWESARKEAAKGFSYSRYGADLSVHFPIPGIAAKVDALKAKGFFAPGQGFGVSYAGPAGFVSIGEMPASTLEGIMAMVFTGMHEYLMAKQPVEKAPVPMEKSAAPQAAAPVEKKQ